MLPKPQKVARTLSLSQPWCCALLAAPALLPSLLRAAPSRAEADLQPGPVRQRCSRSLTC